MARARIVPIGFAAGFEGALRRIIGPFAVVMAPPATAPQGGAKDRRRGPALAVTDRIAESRLGKWKRYKFRKKATSTLLGNLIYLSTKRRASNTGLK